MHAYDDDDITINLFGRLCLRISCKSADWQLSSLSQLYNSALSPLFTLEILEIHNSRDSWEEDMENVQWLEFLRLFPSLKDLVLSVKSFRLVAPALNELGGESIIEVLRAAKCRLTKPTALGTRQHRKWKVHFHNVSSWVVL